MNSENLQKNADKEADNAADHGTCHPSDASGHDHDNRYDDEPRTLIHRNMILRRDTLLLRPGRARAKALRGLLVLAAVGLAACTGLVGDVRPVPSDVIRVMADHGWQVTQVSPSELSSWPSPDAARSAVRELVGQGYDFSEVYACRIQLNAALPGQTPSTLGDRAYAIWARSPGRPGTDWLFFEDFNGADKDPIAAIQQRDLAVASAKP